MNRTAVSGILLTLLLGSIGVTVSSQPIKAEQSGVVELLMVTDEWFYGLGENVTIALINIGNETAAFSGWPPWVIYTYPAWEPVYPAIFAPLTWDLEPGELETWTWNQFDQYNGTFVGPGTYVVQESNYNLTAFFEITPLVLEMTVSKDRITAGEEIDITLTLRNMGTSTIAFEYGPPLFDVLYCTPDACFAWSDDKYFPQIVLSLTLEPGESHSEMLQWDLYQYVNYTLYPPDPGIYRLHARACILLPVATPTPVAVTVMSIKTLLGTGWGWIKIEPNQSVSGRARLSRIRDEQIELIIIWEGKEYSRTWTIIYRRECKHGEIYVCDSHEWGFLIVGLCKHRRWEFWIVFGRDAIAFGFQSHEKLMPI